MARQRNGTGEVRTATGDRRQTARAEPRPRCGWSQWSRSCCGYDRTEESGSSIGGFRPASTLSVVGLGALGRRPVPVCVGVVRFV